MGDKGLLGLALGHQLDMDGLIASGDSTLLAQAGDRPGPCTVESSALGRGHRDRLWCKTSCPSEAPCPGCQALEQHQSGTGTPKRYAALQPYGTAALRRHACVPLGCQSSQRRGAAGTA